MSWLSKGLKKLGKGAKRLVTQPGKALENIGRSVGATVKTAAPVLGVIPGVGPIAAAGLSALGSVAAGGNMQDHLKAGISGGMGGLGKAAALSKIPGVSQAVGALGKIPGVDRLGSAIGKIPGVEGLSDILGNSQAMPESIVPMGDSGGGGIGGLIGDATDWLKGNSGKNALGLAQGINTVLQQKKANDLAKSALRGTEAEYAAGAPLRAQGLSSLLNPQIQDLSSLRSSISTGNPYGG